MTTIDTFLSPERFTGFALPRPGPQGLAEADRSRLIAALADMAVDWSVLAEHVRFGSEGYSRTRLYRDDVWEMLLLGWLPGQATPIHDHGSSWGATLILMGDLIEERFRSAEGQPLAPLPARQARPGDVLVETVDTIHRLGNRSAFPSLSLHLYTQPLTDPNLYDETGQRLPWRL